MPHHVSSSCEGEICALCSQPATHKVGEEIPFDDPQHSRHNYTAYVCCMHFRAIFGTVTACPAPQPVVSTSTTSDSENEPVAWIHRTTGRLQRFAPRTEQVASWQPLYDFDRRAGAAPIAWLEQHTDGRERVTMVEPNGKQEPGWRRVTPLFGWNGSRK